MRKQKPDLQFNDWMEQMIYHFGDEDFKMKTEFVKNFLIENFKVDEFENTYLQIERLNSKSFMWLLLSLILDFENTKEKPNEQLSKQTGLGDSPSNKMKLFEKTGMQEKIKSLEVEEIFLIEDMTAESVQFIEQFLQKTNVDLEAEVNYYFILSTNQIIYLLRKIMQEYSTFLSNGMKLPE